MGDGRHVDAIDARRRDWRGAGGPTPEGSERILALGRGGTECVWSGVGRRVGRGNDQVDVERVLWAAVDAGLVVIRERRNRRGDWEPYRWRLTVEGEALVAIRAEPVDVTGYLAESTTADDGNHPVLHSIREWLRRGEGTPTSQRLVIAIGRELRVGRIPRERLLSKKVTGLSKALRVDDYSADLELALGMPADEVVRKAGDAAVVAGPIRFRVAGIDTDARGVPPWLALPRETIDSIEVFEIDADRLITIENQTPFEEQVRLGLPPRSVALYVGGFAGYAERRILERFVEAGVRRVDHWSDLDVGGLRILRQLGSLVSVEVRPFRMEPELLARLPTDPLTENDKRSLRAWLADPEAPYHALASALLHADRKAEQEGWFLREHHAVD